MFNYFVEFRNLGLSQAHINLNKVDKLEIKLKTRLSLNKFMTKINRLSIYIVIMH